MLSMVYGILIREFLLDRYSEQLVLNSPTHKRHLKLFTAKSPLRYVIYMFINRTQEFVSVDRYVQDIRSFGNCSWDC